jgi:hypothetical protein
MSSWFGEFLSATVLAVVMVTISSVLPKEAHIASVALGVGAAACAVGAVVAFFFAMMHHKQRKG